MWCIITIVAVGLIVDIILYKALGWRVVGDAPRYLTGARSLLDGLPLTDRQLGYIGYITWTASFTFLGLGTEWVLVAQLTLSLLAALAAFDLGRCGQAGVRVWSVVLHGLSFSTYSDGISTS